jgi:hypothetical protein
VSTTCDEGEAYAHKLTEAGVQVTAVRYLGTVHDFMLLNAITADPGGSWYGMAFTWSSCHSRLTPTFRPGESQRDLAPDRRTPCWNGRPGKLDYLLHWPPRLPDTRRALAAAEWSRLHQPRAFHRLHQGPFEAHFVLGEDLEDSAVIDRHASESGIDLGALHAALADGRAAAALAEAEKIGLDHGVRGTPAWIGGPKIDHRTPPGGRIRAPRGVRHADAAVTWIARDTVDGRVTIRRTVGQVFTLYRDLRTLPRFLGDVMAVEPIDPAFRPGIDRR